MIPRQPEGISNWDEMLCSKCAERVAHPNHDPSRAGSHGFDVDREMPVRTIDEVFVGVMVDPLDRTEGLIVFPDGRPFIGADESALASMRRDLPGLKRIYGLGEVKLLRFSKREELES